jgi:hypothetical protein
MAEHTFACSRMFSANDVDRIRNGLWLPLSIHLEAGIFLVIIGAGLYRAGAWPRETPGKAVGMTGEIVSKLFSVCGSTNPTEFAPACVLFK